jgi:arabinose-5-phosphate isomerase
MSYLKEAKNVIDIEVKGLEYLSRNLNENFDSAIKAILETKGRVAVTGMGKSGLVGKKIVATLASTGTRSFFIHPGEAYHGDLGMISPNDVVIAISNSGETEEVIKLLSFFNDNKNTVISMTAKEDSTLAKYSDIFLNISVEKEACPLALAPTASTTVTMALGDALAVSLMKARDFKEESFARFHPGGSLGRKLLVKAKDIMKTADLPIVKSDDLFADILNVISKGRMGIAVVIDSGKCLGVITDGDIRRILADEKEKALLKVASDFYSKNPKSIPSDTKIVDIEKLMNQYKITSVLVIESGKLLGIVDRYDC